MITLFTSVALSPMNYAAFALAGLAAFTTLTSAAGLVALPIMAWKGAKP